MPEVSANRRAPLIGGAVLGALVIVWQIICVGAGLDALFPLVATGIEVAVLLAVLWSTRRSQGYTAQLMGGVLATAVSLPAVVAGFVLCVSVLFPTAVPPDAIVAQGLAGVVGTAVTGVVVSAIAAVFLRTRD